MREEELPVRRWQTARPLLVRVLDRGRQDEIGVRGEEAPARREEDIILRSPISLMYRDGLCLNSQVSG